MYISSSFIMKKQAQPTKRSLWILITPLIIFIMLVGSPFYTVHRLVQWASKKTDNATGSTDVALS